VYWFECGTCHRSTIHKFTTRYTIYPHGIAKSIIGVFTLIERMNILGFAQHGGTKIMD
jgi:hypothetical protein